MSVGYMQRALWPEFDVEEASVMHETNFVTDLVKALGLPKEFTRKAELHAFSDGSASILLTIDLTPEQVSYLHAIKQSHD
jgi:hypothetical protein